MEKAPLPLDDEERLAALAEYQILDTAAESIFDKITETASVVCGVPISLISLIAKDRQWFKSNHGLENSTESSRDVSFCAHAILDSDIMEVPDASKDKRFSDNPFVLEDPHIRFYAGVPLINPRGFKLGTLCVIDREPKQLTESQRQILQNLSEIIIKIFEIKKGILNDINQRKLAAEALAQANSKLKKKLVEQKQSRHELILLSEMSSILQASISSDEAYMVIKKFCRQLFPDTDGSLYLLHTSRHHVELAAAWGNKSEQKGILSLEDCWALRRGQPYFVDSTEDLACKHMQTYDKQPNYMCIPLLAQGEILGLLSIVMSDQASKNQVNEEHRLLAIAMAEQISLALANAKLRETLHYQSLRDPLTGLYNRRYLNEILKNEFPVFEKEKANIAFILFDIDFFKNFNDTYGHDIGDVVLIEAAKTLLSSLQTKGWVCRFGGEEFITILPHVTLNEATHYAEEVMNNIKKIPIKHNEQLLKPITFSVGIAMYPKDGKTIDELFNAADAALYQAKETGRAKIIIVNDQTQTT